MPRAEVVIMQLDIAGHSKINVPERVLLEVRARLERYVTALVTAAGAKNLQWQGDGGWCYFIVTDSAVFEDACDAGIDILFCLPRVNDWCQRTGRMRVPLALRVSLHAMNVELDSNMGHVASRDMNSFLKVEREVGLKDTLIVTDAVHRQLSQNLKDRFDRWKKHDAVGVLYAYQGRSSRNEQLRRLRSALRQEGTQDGTGNRFWVDVTAFHGERYIDIARQAYEGVDAELPPQGDDDGPIGSVEFLAFRSALAAEVIKAASSARLDFTAEDIADDPYTYAAQLPQGHAMPIEKANAACDGNEVFVGGEEVRLFSPDALGFRYAIGDSTELDCVAAGRLRIESITAGVEPDKAPEKEALR